LYWWVYHAVLLNRRTTMSKSQIEHKASGGARARVATKPTKAFDDKKTFERAFEQAFHDALSDLSRSINLKGNRPNSTSFRSV
jgi:hypothetical protein